MEYLLLGNKQNKKTLISKSDGEPLSYSSDRLLYFEMGFAVDGQIYRNKTMEYLVLIREFSAPFAIIIQVVD
jgi:hypothetical protein